MKKLVRFNISQLIRIPFLVVCALIVLICFVVYGVIILSSNASFINYISQFDRFTYLELVVILVMFCYATYSMHLPTAFESACLFSEGQIRFARMISTLIVSLSLCTFPIIFVCINSILQQTDLLFSLNAVVYVIIRWFLLIGAAETAAFISVFLVRTNIAYLFSIPSTIILSYLNRTLIQLAIPNSADKVSALFSMQTPFVGATGIDYTGARVDWFLLSKLFYVLIGIVVAFCFIWAASSSKKTYPWIIFSFLLVLECGSVYLWVELYPKQYQYEEKLYITDYAEQNATIESYIGELKIDEKCDIHCNLEVNTSQQADIRFRLDECFTIDEISCENESLSFKRDRDYLIIKIPDGAKSELVISFHYHGRIYYLSNIQVIDIFATHRSTALPAQFAFLPMIDGDLSTKKYDLIVKSGNTLISNLNVDAMSNLKYHVSGEASTCSLFSGYFTQFEQDGIVFYRAKYNQITNYEDVYRTSLNYRGFDAFSVELIDEYQKPKKVFMIYSLYGVVGFPIVYDNYFILNYGFDAG